MNSIGLCVVEEVGENGEERAERRCEEEYVVDGADWDENDLDEKQRVEKENEENHFEHVQSTGFDLYSLIVQLSDFYAPRRNIERKAGRETRKRALRKAKSVEA